MRICPDEMPTVRPNPRSFLIHLVPFARSTRLVWPSTQNSQSVWWVTLHETDVVDDHEQHDGKKRGAGNEHVPDWKESLLRKS